MKVKGDMGLVVRIGQSENFAGLYEVAIQNIRSEVRTKASSLVTEINLQLIRQLVKIRLACSPSLPASLRYSLPIFLRH